MFSACPKHFQIGFAILTNNAAHILDDADKRVQLLLDVMNNGLVDARLVPVLQQLAQAIQARNQQGALQLHVQLVTMATGDVATALVGVKFLIAKLYS